MKRGIIAAAIGMALLSGNATADINWKNYKGFEASLERRNDERLSTTLDAYVLGAFSALEAMNMVSEIAGRGPSYKAFCAPAGLSLNPTSLRQMLKTSKIRKSLADELPLGGAVLLMLRDVFPCNP